MFEIAFRVHIKNFKMPKVAKNIMVSPGPRTELSKITQETTQHT
jgi:hypothetical protein